MGATFFQNSTTVRSLGQNINLNNESLIVNGELAATNNTANQTLTTLSPTVVRSAMLNVSVSVDGTTDVYENFILNVINKGGVAFEMSQTSAGDISGISFDVTSAGVIRATTPNIGGFVSCTIKFTGYQTLI